MELKQYVLLMRHSRFWLVGPFADQDEAAEWGRCTQTAVNDDPRWQTIQLPAEYTDYPPLLFAPDHPKAAENGAPD